MKTKLQILGAFVSLLAFSNASMAWEPTFNTSTKKSSTFNVVTPSDNCKSILTNGAVMNDGTVISTTSTSSNEENIDNVNSILSYHHGSSSGSGAINGKNIVYLGVGFISLTGIFTTVWTAAGYSASSIPPIVLAYERGLSDHFGVGARLSYSATTLTLGTGQDPFYNNGNPYTDKVTYTGFMFVATFAYHFGDNEKVDPYLMGALGYTSLSEKFTTTDTQAPGDGNVSLSTGTLGGFTFGGVFGCRFYFTNNIGAWLDFGYMGYGAALFNLGLSLKF